MFAETPAGESPAERARSLGEELRDTPGSLSGILEALFDGFVRHLPGAIVGLLVFGIFWLLSRLAVRVARKFLSRARVEAEAIEILLSLTRAGVLAIGLLMALDQMGFEVGSLLAGVGIAGLAIGLAAQESIANLLAGFTILWDRPFRIGDFVTVTGAQGEVTEIGLRSIRLRTPDRREVILPNKEVIQKAIVNHSRYPEIRLTAQVTIAHDASIDEARTAILAALAGESWILESPSPRVLVSALGPAGIGLDVWAWMQRPESPDRSAFRILELTRSALAGAGVELARPAAPLTAPPSRP